MTRALFIAVAAFALLATAPAMNQTKQQEKRESPGEAASQAQRGGLKKDRKITHHILQHERETDRNARASYSRH